ncbi:MAG: tripartite tricarboxylate transporter TctB family protein [Candidatus Rokubacteria bacterium]|nr:tripartite tricarboxylate transporter TctB family protein [Candidatus Rokubacteria bacterium]
MAAPLAGVIVAIGLLFASRGLDTVSAPGQLGPSFWPRLVLAGLVIACLAKAVEARRARGRGAADAAPPAARARLATAIALVVLYVALAPLLGFPLTTALFIAGFLVLGGAGRPLMLAANSFAGTVALLYLFVKLVYLPLPKGGGPFETFTLALYRALRIF